MTSHVDESSFVHQAAIYGSHEELCRIAVPFLLEGLANGEATFAILDAVSSESLGAVIGQPVGLTYLAAEDQYRRPATTIRRYLELLCAARERDESVRLVAQVPHPGTGSAWDWWGRYEAAVNAIFKDFSLRAICAYDRRSTPEAVLDEVHRTHPFLTDAQGTKQCASYEPLEVFLQRRSSAYVDTFEMQPPMIDICDPTLADARATVTDLADGAGFDAVRARDFVLATSEIVANAAAHGKGAVRLQAWAAPDRLFVSVSDEGNGLEDELVGLIPVDASSKRGRGLWIAHQCCDHVAMGPGPDGFTIKLVAGEPSL